MSFRIAVIAALLLAGLTGCLFSTAQAQSANGAQHIVFSSPNGQITTKAPLPMTQAPEPQQAPDLPAPDVSGQPFSESVAEPAFPLPPQVLPQDNAQDQDNLQDPMHLRTELGALTPAQIMNVPSAEQIFGLPESGSEAQKKPWQTENNATNSLGSDTTAIIGDPGWAKAWSGNIGNSAGTSNTTERASGLFGGFFDSARNDNIFGNQSESDRNSDTGFGPPQPAAQRSPWSADLINGAIPPPASATPDNFHAPGASPDSEFTSQSPFTPPQASSLDALPKLPTLPSLPGQSDKFNQPSAAPSWGPKPPPWTQSQTPFGTPIH